MSPNPLINRPGTLTAPSLDYLLIDGSGSMAHKWGSTMAFIDQFVDVLRTRNVSSHGIAHVFDHQFLHDIQLDCAIGDWPALRARSLRLPGGSTPLYDAINLMARELRDIDPPRASIAIVTDGEENASQHTSLTQAKALLDWCRAKGWTVTFIGAEFNNTAQARALGSDDSNTIGVQTRLLGDAGKLYGDKRASNALTGTDINFTSDERTTFGGYLAGPSA